MEYLKSILAVDGDMSCMRLLSLISLISGVAVAFWGIYLGKDLMSLSVLVGVFVGSSFGGKALQAKFENGSSK